MDVRPPSHTAIEPESQLRAYRAMVAHANDAMLLLDSEQIVASNPAAERLFGRPQSELTGMHPAALSPAQQPGGQASVVGVRDHIMRAREGESQRFLWQHQRQNGETFTAEVTLSPALHDAASDRLQLVAVLRDVTAAQAAAQALQASEQRFRKLFELAPIPLALTTADGSLVDINRQWTRLLGYTAADLHHIDQWWSLAYPDPAYRAQVKALWTKAYQDVRERGRELRPVELRVHDKTGRAHHLVIGGAMVGEHMLTSFYDITDRRKAQQELEDLNASLEARVQARTAELQVAFEELRHTQDELVRKEKLASLGALVAGMAHELNTPIGNAVIVASTLSDLRQQFDVEVARGLRRSVLSRFTADVAEAVDVMERNLRRAAELIAGFKQVAVDQSSHQRRPFELSEVVHELHLALSPTLRRRGVQWVEQVPAGLQMDSYPGPLSQVLMNIVNNAVTHAFDQQASPRIAVRAEPVSDTHIQITLHDNGCGIAPEHQQRVFDPFFTTRLGRGGSGLGMHIVYSLVTGLLGGRVHLDSTPGHGCTLTLTLPRTAPVATTPLPTS